jgi:DNA-directed RNA polymerase sigma subunit (sigma70/sigma32)
MQKKYARYSAPADGAVDYVRTQAEVAALLGVTRARITQIEHRAMAKLRRALGVDLQEENSP